MPPWNEQAHQIYLQALQHEGEQAIDAFVRRACGDNTELRRHVEALLHAVPPDSRGPALPTHAVPVERKPLPHEVGGFRPQPDVFIGSYRLIKKLGEGGMGAVWLAEQEAPFKRSVALKLVRSGSASEQVLARFDAERQALALMDHPAIATIFDAGTTPDGTPYFVMEWVKGIPITDFCDQERLTPHARLKLFMDVCQAVQHAHQKGIIHRDLKPSNILVAWNDGQPGPKIIDFGVAKATARQLSETPLYTEAGAVVGTLEYMAPEQAEPSNLDIDTRADIYALGVILYELLTGSLPFPSKDLRAAGIAEMIRMIREVEPPRPSTRLSASREQLPALAAQRKVEPSRLTRLLTGDLDWIVMKCLEKERHRRYETANGLGLDIERYLRHEPVLAGPPSRIYRMKKFIRRNRAGVIAASAVVLSLLAGLALAAWQAVVANEAREQALFFASQEKKAKEAAQAGEAEARSVLDFVQSRIFAAARPQGLEGGLGFDVTVRNAMRAALPFIEKQFTDQPLVEARVRTTMAASFWLLSDAEFAVEQFEKAQRLYSRHLGEDSEEYFVCVSGLANTYYALGRFNEAVEMNSRAVARLERTQGQDHRNTLAAMNNEASCYDALGKHDKALVIRERILELTKARYQPDDLLMIAALHNLAVSYHYLKRTKEAIELNEKVLALHKSKYGDDHPHTLRAASNLVVHYTEQKRYEDALILAKETLTSMNTKNGPDHSDTLSVMNNLANIYSAMRQYEESLELHVKVLAAWRKKHGPDHPDSIAALANVATALNRLKRYDEALASLDECLERARGKQVDPRMHTILLNTRFRIHQTTNNLAGCRATAQLWEAMRKTDAESLYRAACMRSMTSEMLQKATPADTTTAKLDADKAMEWLRRALTAGYSKPDKIKTDKELAALRRRDDFQKLLVEAISTKDK